MAIFAPICTNSPLRDACGPVKPLRIPAMPRLDLSVNPGRLTPGSTMALIGALIALVGALALGLDRAHNGDFYLSLGSGRFIAQHGFASQDPFATIAQGGTWLNQQWLSELPFFRVPQALGPPGLAVPHPFLTPAPPPLLLRPCPGKGAPT